MKRILYVHHSAELYGSDKVLLSLVAGLDKTRYEPIVVLPEKGPLLGCLDSAGVKSIILPLMRISRSTLSLAGILSLPVRLCRSVIAFRSAFKDVHIDIVHSNTLAVLSGAVWAKVKGIPHVWHVHEMIVDPPFIRRFFPWLLKYLAFRIVCVSAAVKQLLLTEQPRLADKTLVVWNGVERTAPVDRNAAMQLRDQVGAGKDEILVALAGRINRWKGQRLLVEAAELLWSRGWRNIRYLIAGDVPPRQEAFRNDLLSRLAVSPVREFFTLTDFLKDVWPLWDACDIAVVPSVEPEPFGMVAVEAMAAGKPVIAAAHGGLAEIVVDQQTGILVRPGDAQALANALEHLVMLKEKRIFLGSNGLERVRSVFSLAAFIAAFESMYAAFDLEAKNL